MEEVLFILTIKFSMKNPAKIWNYKMKKYQLSSKTNNNNN